jgi:hypothetical protein
MSAGSNRSAHSQLPVDFAALPPGSGFPCLDVDGGISEAVIEALYLDPEPVGASTAVAHQALQPIAGVVDDRLTVKRAGALGMTGVSFAATRSEFRECNEVAPPLEVAQRRSVDAGAARSVRVHPREGAGSLSISECMSGVVT